MDKSGSPEPLGLRADGGQIAEEVAVSGKLFRCAWLRRLVPLAYREELYHVLRLTGPLLISRILIFLLPFVITIACGHLGNAELAGYALASATINFTTTATGCGLALACDTLVSQTYGSKNLKRVGEILQRSTLILMLFCLPCWAILINAESILLSLRQEPEVSRIAQLYVLAFLPAVPVSQLMLFLVTKGIILPQLYTAAAANVINAVTNYVLIFWMELGVKGSAAANSISQITICLLLFGYIRWKKLHVKTWGGWSSASLQDWGSFMELAIPSSLMVCFEWWIYEIGGFLAGMLGEVDLAAQHVLLELGSIMYMFPLGVHVAACVRVGNALGAGNVGRALITCRVCLAISGILAVFQAILLGSTKSVIGYIFTTDAHCCKCVMLNNLLVIFMLHLYFVLQCVSSGILIGSGKQKIAAVSNLICYYCIGLPLGIALMFAAELRIFGLWLGLSVCVILQMCFFITLIFRLNWQSVSEKAQKRALKCAKVTSVGQKPPIGPIVMDTLAPEGLDAQGGGDGSKLSGYSLVSTQEQAHLEKGKPGLPERTEGKGALLSISQLILRRGLTLLAAVVILAAGVAVHIIFPPPETPLRPPLSNLTLDWANTTAIPTAILNFTSPF
uniref:Multidrug and toxin extrusion protein n=1 Tax=Denticeps clupeoides TaxID=299321 RepID=A0AAY4AMS1_9TELE